MSPMLLLAAGASGAMLERAASQPMSMMVLLVALSAIPFAALMVTSFSKMVVVFSLLRSAIGAQQAPPTSVLTGLAAVLSLHVMAPVIERTIEATETVTIQMDSPGSLLSTSARVAEPIRAFLLQHAGANERQQLAAWARELRQGQRTKELRDDEMSILAPAFVLTELKEAFRLGFVIFLPFLVLDMVVANVLLALGMQTLSPTQVSLPFKILLFVAVDGWLLIARGLTLGYA